MSQNRNLVVVSLMLILLAGIWGATSSSSQPTAGAATNDTILLHTTLDDNDAITHPVVGLGGTSTLSAGDFVPAHSGAGAHFSDGSKVVTFPAASGSTQNVELDRGEVEFWYRPDYAAGAPDDVGHHLLTVGQADNVPSLILTEADSLRLSLTDAGWNSYVAQAGWREALWSAGDWVHIRAVWDNADPDPLRIYVDGVRVDGGSADNGWDLGPETDVGDIFVGAGSATGAFSAAGTIDEFIIRSAPQTAPAPTSSPTATPTPTGTALTPTATATPTTTPTATLTGTAAPPNGGITDPDVVVTPADLPLQPVGTPFTDLVFGTTLRRVSDASETGSFGTHIYSQLQAFAADNAYVLLIENDNYVVRRVDDLSLVEGLDTAGWNVPRWQPAQPHTVVHYDSDADTTIRVQYTNVDTLDTTTVFTFPSQYDRIENNQSFDELSEDGHWMAGMASLSNGERMIFALDLENLELGAQFTISELYAGPCEPDPEWGDVGPDWIGVSPLGNYLVVQWQRDGTTRCSGLETFDLQTGEFVGRVYDGHQHGDLGVLPDGETEFFMTFELYHPSGNLSLGVRELPGNATVSEPAYVQVLDWGNGAHISCQGPHGVCLVTAGTWDDNGWSNFEGELFLQYIDGRVRRLTHHRSSSCGYWVQPRASISRDGGYVVFASDWKHGTGSDSCSTSDLGQGDPYVIDLGSPAPEIPTACSPDADDDGVVNVVDIEMRAGEPSCQAYLPLIASYWRQTWPASSQP